MRFRTPITLSDADRERLEKAKAKIPTIKADWPAARTVLNTLSKALPKVSVTIEKKEA